MGALELNLDSCALLMINLLIAERNDRPDSGINPMKPKASIDA
jgi:hypothetical protein